MDLDGSNLFQVTQNIPINGFNLEELDFTWANNDSSIYYSNFDKLYQISPNGTGLSEVYQTTDGSFITEVDWNEQTSTIAIKTNNSIGYDASIFTINTSGVVQDMILNNVDGAIGGLDFSFDGSKLLYTYDITGNENSEYRQLDSNMFIYDFIAMTSDNVSDGKEVGTNDLDARFSPNEAKVIFVNTSNDGISQKNIYTMIVSDAISRTELFQDANMPDWK